MQTRERWPLRCAMALACAGMMAGAAQAQVKPLVDGNDAFVTFDRGEANVAREFQKSYEAAFRTLPVRAGRTGGRGGAVTVAQLRRIAPQLPVGVATQTVPQLNKTMQKYQINTPKRMAAFLAQLAHESGGFIHRTELASGRAYNGRRSLGNTQPGDGPRFKGRGFIQLTGRANYRKAGRALGQPFERQPTLVARVDHAASVSGWFWNMRRLNPLADAGNFAQITRRINGGQNGRRSREQYHARARRVLGAGSARPA